LPRSQTVATISLSGFANGDDTLLKMNDIDQQLLQRYSQDRAEDAFAELVRRYLNLVYSAALRQVQSPQAAKDVSQSVFNDLARSAGQLKKNTVLSAWLYEVTRRTAIDFIRQETRRKAREQAYTGMNVIDVASDENWREVLPHLDAAMEELESADRAAVLLRFFENKSLREVGAELGVSDDAARKRIERAVERLRKCMSQRGVTVAVGGLMVLVSANALQAAPAGLAASIASTAFASATISAAAAPGAAKILAGGAFQKVLIIASVGLATVAVVLVWAHSARVSKTKSTAVSVSKPAAAPNEPATQAVAISAEPLKPDAVQLLRGVLQARQQIQSGTLEFEDAVDRFNNDRKDTRQYRFVASFDGTKLRFESFGHEYAYKFDEDEAKQKEIEKRVDGMDRDAAVRAGLSEESTVHHTLVSDGTTIYDYYQSSRQSPDVHIKSVTNGIGSFIFDPRGIGLSSYFSIDFSRESLVSKGADLVGEEDLDGKAAYHIRVNGSGLNYWLDKTHPERLLQVKYGQDVVKSKYNEANFGDPIPDEVDMVNYRNGAVSDESRLVCTSKSYNTPIDAQSFTLAGMGLAVGTDVSDDRIYRRLGYWTGSGLSDDLPSKNHQSQPAPRLDDMLAVVESDPGSSNALQCATWIILNTPDGEAVQKAADVILREHVADTNLVSLCQELDRVRPSCSKALLTGLLEKNPSIEVRGNACFTLATMLKSEAKFGQNKEATAQAIEKYQRVIKEFSSVKQRGYSLADLAKQELNELQNLIIGKPAPEMTGVDMNGHSLSLSTYRGRVTVVVFWAGQFIEALKFQKLNEEMAGKPFALVGVNCDNAASKDDASFAKVTWPSFKDGRDGPIAKLWNVNGWADTWVLDRNGVIRYRDLRVWDVQAAVNKLLEE
jgi:RNA polymerase sigma factor (sigma-70 family)